MQANKFDSEKCKAFVQKEFMSSALPSLVDYIKIENLSKAFCSEQEWANEGWQNLEKAAEHIKKWVEGQKVKGTTIEIISNKAENLTPLIFIEVKGQLDETILFYGHYDKQPPFVGWNQGLGPYTPVLTPSAENPQKLYGRGGADDGYSTYGSILAIKALQEQGIPTPRCVVIVEGDEESGSGDVERHVSLLKDRIGNPKLIFCLDSGTIDYDRLWLTNSLRGFLAVNLKVEVLSEGVHSGSSSGYVPNVFRILRTLVDRLQDQETGVMVKELDVDIPPNRYQELYELAAQLKEGAIREFPLLEGVQTVSPQPLEGVFLGGWRPQLAVTGIDGLPSIGKAGNVNLPFIEAKLSIRLPPTKNRQEAQKFVIKTLTHNPPYNAKVTAVSIGSGDGFNAPLMPEALGKSIADSSQIYFGNKMLTIAEGGSIPFMGFLQQKWPKAKFIVTGLLGPASNAHGPNEFMHIPYVKKLIGAMAHILAHSN